MSDGGSQVLSHFFLIKFSARFQHSYQRVGSGSELREEGGLDDDAQTYVAGVLLVVEQALAIAVVELCEQILVGFKRPSPGCFHRGIEIEHSPCTTCQHHRQ